MEPLILEGNNFKIGRELGRHWGNYFGNLGDKTDHYRNYKKWLQDVEMDEGRGALLTNVARHFPNLFDELAGMYVGINESSIGFKVSQFGLFTCWLAETDYCSSVVMKIDDGYFLAHSDEYKERFPMVVADVSLETDNHTKKFVSISHPFQLLGSAAGMNRYFAFQGNSIGCNANVSEKLKATWHKRVPKTVFTRMMLELSEIQQIEALYEEYATTLPNHHYVVSSERAVSIEVRPTSNDNKLVVNDICKNIQMHTNHFQKSTSDKWDDGNIDESKRRFAGLKKVTEGVENPDQIKTIFSDFLEEYPKRAKQENKLIRRTSGVFFFTIQKGKPLSCEARLLYDEEEKVNSEAK